MVDARPRPRQQISFVRIVRTISDFLGFRRVVPTPTTYRGAWLRDGDGRFGETVIEVYRYY
jgi:hypothetical protein